MRALLAPSPNACAAMWLLPHADEPTSGLDSYTANEVMTVVKSLAGHGITVCATIHSPTPYCFNLFDSLLLLLRGQVVYFGTNGGWQKGSSAAAVLLLLLVAALAAPWSGEAGVWQEQLCAPACFQGPLPTKTIVAMSCFTLSCPCRQASCGLLPHAVPSAGGAEGGRK